MIVKRRNRREVCLQKRILRIESIPIGEEHDEQIGYHTCMYFNEHRNLSREGSGCTHYIVKSDRTRNLGVTIDNYIDNELMVLPSRQEQFSIRLIARTRTMNIRKVPIGTTFHSTWRADWPLVQSWELADASAQCDEHFRRCCGYALAQTGYTVVAAAVAAEGVEVELGSDPDEVEGGAEAPGIR
jgi:hypothetical protein